MNDPSCGIVDHWEDAWTISKPLNHDLASQLEQRLPGFHLPRQKWSTLNLFSWDQRRCVDLMTKWNPAQNVRCDCGLPNQTTSHNIITGCPIYSFNKGLHGLVNLVK